MTPAWTGTADPADTFDGNAEKWVTAMKPYLEKITQYYNDQMKLRSANK